MPLLLISVDAKLQICRIKRTPMSPRPVVQEPRPRLRDRIGPSTVSSYSKLRVSKSIREARSGLAMRQAENFLLVGDCLLCT
jgi:hypothetical protein